MSIRRMPDILAHGRWRSGDELDAIARGWLRGRARRARRPRATRSPSRCPPPRKAWPCCVALSSLPSPVILLAARRPRVAHRAGDSPRHPGRPAPDARAPGARRRASSACILSCCPKLRRAATGPPIDPFNGPGVVLFTSGSTGVAEARVLPDGPRSSPGSTPQSPRWASGPARASSWKRRPPTARASPTSSPRFVLGGPLGLLDPRDHRLALATLAEPAFQVLARARVTSSTR